MVDNASWKNRYLLTQVGSHRLVFSAPSVSEILTLEKRQVLTLPFYNPAVLGVFHYQGTIIPLVSTQSFLSQESQGLYHRNLIAVRLSTEVGTAAGVGVVVDNVLGSLTQDQLTQEHIFHKDDLPTTLWKPQR